MLRPGDRVNWLCTQRGGYGYVVPVAAVVRKVTVSRVMIEVARMIDGRWVHETKAVKADKLRPGLWPLRHWGKRTRNQAIRWSIR